MLNKWLPVWSKPVGKPIKDRELRKQHEHTLTYTKDFDPWHCTACLSHFRKKQSAKNKPWDQLAGHMLSVIAQAQENGHNVWICNLVEATGKFVVCNRCGCYAQVRAE